MTADDPSRSCSSSRSDAKSGGKRQAVAEAREGMPGAPRHWFGMNGRVTAAAAWVLPAFEEETRKRT